MKNLSLPSLILCAAILSMGSSRCSNKYIVKPDAGMSAVKAEDYTALIEGCGNQTIAGYTYCRKAEGDISSEFLFLVAPPVKCLDDPAIPGEEPCVTWKIFFPDGSPSFGGSVPRDQTRSEISWKDLVKRDTIQKGDSGFWGYTYRIRWIDPEKRENFTKSFGEIRLRVLSRDYTPLHETPDDENFVWTWTEGNTLIRMTTGARTYVGHSIPSPGVK